MIALMVNPHCCVPQQATLDWSLIDLKATSCIHEPVIDFPNALLITFLIEHPGKAEGGWCVAGTGVDITLVSTDVEGSTELWEWVSQLPCCSTDCLSCKFNLFADSSMPKT